MTVMMKMMIIPGTEVSVTAQAGMGGMKVREDSLNAVTLCGVENLVLRG